MQRNGLNPFARSRTTPLTVTLPLNIFKAPEGTHSQLWKRASSAWLAKVRCEHGGRRSAGLRRLEGGLLSRREARGWLLSAAASGSQSSPKGGASLINIITQASCLESPHMENCLLQSVEAAKSPAESIDFYFNDVCDQYLNRIDRACC